MKPKKEGGDSSQEKKELETETELTISVVNRVTLILVKGWLVYIESVCSNRVLDVYRCEFGIDESRKYIRSLYIYIYICPIMS